MRLAITLALSLAVGQGGASELALTKVRATHGLLGPIRSERRVLPGDSLCLAFDIEGITVGAHGRVRYAMGLEAVDAKGKVVYRQNPADQEATASLGGKTAAMSFPLTVHPRR
jgi:hypothetical protein